MGLVIGLLTIVLIVNSLLLTLLVLIQLPKKEAGAGLAFGGGASDALFGAGRGTVLSQVTKYSAGLFLALCLGLSVLYTHEAKASRARIANEVERQAASTPVTPPAVPAPNLTNLSLPGTTSTVPVTNLAAPAPAAHAEAPTTNAVPPVAPGR